jgi:hypothetical protein
MEYQYQYQSSLGLNYLVDPDFKKCKSHYIREV